MFACTMQKLHQTNYTSTCNSTLPTAVPFLTVTGECNGDVMLAVSVMGNADVPTSPSEKVESEIFRAARKRIF